MVGLLALVSRQAFAAPVSLPRRIEWQWVEGRDPDTLVIQFSAASGIYWDDGLQNLPEEWERWRSLLDAVEPRFSRDPDQLEARRRDYDPKGLLPDLRSYVVLRDQEFTDFARAVEKDPRIQHMYLAYLPQPPPSDIPPETPSFVEEQGYLLAAPDGFDSQYAQSWPGGTGAGIRVADIEYSWDPLHEDLINGPQEMAWGWDSGDYAYHGNGVLGELIAADNGYGMTGMIPDAELLMISPYSDPNSYVVADAIENSTALLAAGDVILIEQQAYSFDNYCPVEVAPAIFAAIQHATAQGIVVIEAAGNGYQDLDASFWEGWFDRTLQDSGAIMVGGGEPPSASAPRSWAGSSYGTRVDLQGWYGGIASVGGDGMADLFYPERDPRQAYTAAFGGTSGASPMVTAAVVIANALSLERGGAPWEPTALRAALRATGIPQPPDDPYLVGPQPDIRRFLWTWGLR